MSFLHGARFNQPNTPVLYFSETPAVAMLEMGNYLPSPQLLPASYRLGVYELPDDVPQSPLRWICCLRIGTATRLCRMCRRWGRAA
nr:RES family NAD+ phosphorylase [Pectobacterium colocasium]